MRKTYRWDPARKALVEVSGDCVAAAIAGPHVRRELEPYVSPTTGRLIETHRERRDDLRRSGCIDARDLRGERLANGKIHRG